ncbi:aromatic acid exporter family protein [Macrococcus hajekii]|uniref:Aromatic acid exporter family protein n=1 Tax=Macrococcus hajekii TaxID=198482 RepID=A0A4R6BI90_9STAP|nr:aromatic acid exporter family protein [Macrococcus hajekii]TDM01270.1 aromatic acid exporter family protein [Macrococcus hajekii]GGB10212.1 membrane protein [Macrococcus hajekii]
MKLGARIFKTGIAIMLALYVAQLLGTPGYVVAGISALFAMQPSVYQSYKSVLENLQGNTIGAVLAIIAVQLFGNHLLVIGLFTIILISLLAKLNLQNVTGLAVVTQLVIMEASGDDFMTAALTRFSFIMIGVLSAALVNLLFLPPQYETKLYYSCQQICNDIFKWLRLSINGSTEYHVVKHDVEDIRDRIIALESKFNLYKNERALTRKQNYRNIRKKILFKELIMTTRRAYDLLRRINRYENDILHLPEELRVQIKFEMDELMTLHEGILMQVNNKLSPVHLSEESFMNGHFKKDVLEMILKELQGIEDPPYNKQHIILVLSALFEYREKLEHLDKLTHSFHHYHQDDNKIKVSDDGQDI